MALMLVDPLAASVFWRFVPCGEVQFLVSQGDLGHVQVHRPALQAGPDRVGTDMLHAWQSQTKGPDSEDQEPGLTGIGRNDPGRPSPHVPLAVTPDGRRTQGPRNPTRLARQWSRTRKTGVPAGAR